MKRHDMPVPVTRHQQVVHGLDIPLKSRPLQVRRFAQDQGTRLIAAREAHCSSFDAISWHA